MIKEEHVNILDFIDVWLGMSFTLEEVLVAHPGVFSAGRFKLAINFSCGLSLVS